MAALKAQFKNNLRLAEHFYDEPALQIEFRIIFLGARKLLDLYSATWKTLAQGQVSHMG